MCPFESPSPPFHTILPRIPVIYHFPLKFPDSSHTLILSRKTERERDTLEQRGGNELWTFIRHKAHPALRTTLFRSIVLDIDVSCN